MLTYIKLIQYVVPPQNHEHTKFKSINHKHTTLTEVVSEQQGHTCMSEIWHNLQKMHV